MLDILLERNKKQPYTSMLRAPAPRLKGEERETWTPEFRLKVAKHRLSWYRRSDDPMAVIVADTWASIEERARCAVALKKAKRRAEKIEGKQSLGVPAKPVVPVAVEAPKTQLTDLAVLAKFLALPIEGLPITMRKSSIQDTPRPWSIANGRGTQLSSETLAGLVKEMRRLLVAE